MPWWAATLSDHLEPGTKLVLTHTYVSNRRRVQPGEQLQVEFGQVSQRVHVVSATLKEVILETQAGTRWKLTLAAGAEAREGFREGEGERWVVRGEVAPR